MQSAPQSHGGILVPLDMFRPTILASVVGEALVAKARNILDAQLELVRHPRAQLLLLRVHGSVMGGDAGAFYRENADLALILSQVVPRQLFLYYVLETPERRQGFIVAQRGQALAADDATADQMPPDAHPNEWPVARLCQQIGISLDELARGFPEGPRVSVSLLDPAGDDRELLETLLGDLLGPAEEDGESPPAETRGPAEAAAAAPPEPKRPSAREIAEADQKRRASEQQAEADQRRALAESIRSDLPLARDELGVVVAPRASLDDTDILSAYVVARVRGELPVGLPREWQEELQGKRIDVAVRVEFLSEVFRNDAPLSKARFEGESVERSVAGRTLRALEVHAPRLGRGMLLRSGTLNLFVSRTSEYQLPEAFVIELLGP